MAQSLVCTLITPDAKVFEQTVSHASIPAWDGQIGLLPRRAPLLVKLGDGLLRLDLPEGRTRFYFLGGGFAQMKDDRLTLLTSEAIDESEADRGQAQAALAEAQSRRALSDEEVEQRDRAARRARALIELAGLAKARQPRHSA